MQLIQIHQTHEGNLDCANNPDCDESLLMSIDYYKQVGFVPPWICYYAKKDGLLVGTAAFKGPPVQGRIEIAYGTFDKFRQQGIGTLICKSLVDLAVKTDASLSILARTLPEKNYSTRILEKNNFVLIGTVTDPEDGEVWEWEYSANKFG